MNIFLVLFVSFVVFAFNSSSAQNSEDSLKKYCDPSLTDEKIKELENCSMGSPEEVYI
jgi:hypothetical protein